MRCLILLRGSPGSGKSTWIKNNNLENYTLSSDKIRLLFRSPTFDVDGNEHIDQSSNQLVWETLFNILEKRMQAGELTIIDACNSKSKEFNKYDALIKKYKYRTFCVDFTDIPIETVKEWNKNRKEYQRVSDDTIDLYYSRFDTQKIPSYIKVITRDEALNIISYKNCDLSEYKNIYVIGDIHGCYTPLQKLLKDGINEENYYIFLGDYLDRGIENKQTLEYLFSIANNPNVCLLEGNHERTLWDYANDEEISSNEFLTHTIEQIKDIKKKEIRIFHRKLRQCILFTYNNQKYFCNHAGVSALKDDIIYMATNEFVKGCGKYNDIYEIQNSFETKNPDIIQIHGHRNPQNLPIKQGANSYNLEGQVEKGGYLRAIKINSDGVEEIEIKNDIFRNFEVDETNENVKIEKQPILKIDELVNELRNNKKNIIEKKFNNISSFNFSKDVFYEKNWNDMTTKARGLFINTDNYTIAARSYDKFFNIGETKETEMLSLSKNLKFPIDCYLKYNGFLGIIGYDESKDDLLFCSKSCINGIFSNYFKDIFMNKYSYIYEDILSFVKNNNVSMIFEVIDIENDPHIIEYKENDLILLDVIYRTLDYKKINYEDLQKISKQFGLKVKEKCYTLNSWSEFLEWYSEVTDRNYLYNNKHIEGFVVEDSAGFMTKIKGEYYKFWKTMRKIKDEVFRETRNGGYKGYIDKTAMLTTAEMNYFYGFLKNLASSGYSGKKDIISLRNLYEEENNAIKSF